MNEEQKKAAGAVIEARDAMAKLITAMIDAFADDLDIDRELAASNAWYRNKVAVMCVETFIKENL